jgi:CMP-2-keto-3-deoxyoctulosonic acid synthetase
MIIGDDSVAARMKTTTTLGAKEYSGDRPCIDPAIMQYLQIKLRAAEKKIATHEKIIQNLKSILNIK